MEKKEKRKLKNITQHDIEVFNSLIGGLQRLRDRLKDKRKNQKKKSKTP